MHRYCRVGFRDEHRISHLTASTMAKKHRDDFVMTIDSDSEASDGGDSDTEQKTGDLNPDFVFGEAEETAFTGWDLDQKDVANHKDVDLDGILRSKGGLLGMIDGEEEEQKEEEEENEDNAEDEEEVNAGEDDEDLAMDGFGMGAEQEDDEEEENSEQENEHEAELEDEQEQEDSENDEDSAAAIAEFYEESKTTEKITSFQALQLSRPLLKGVGNLGYTVPSAIQAASIPIAMMGKDIVAGAVTGSGKTAAYLIPIIERLIYKPAAVSATRVIVLTPTRELAIQVCDVGKKLGQFVANLNFGLAVGGLNLRQQEQQLKSRPDIVVATPGRLIDHIRNSPSFSIENLEVLVMDEADRMLEEGFQVELTEILELIPKHKRQTMLFSATMNTKIQDLIQLSLDKPVRIMVNPPKQAASKLVQEFVRIRKREHLKPALLYHLLRLVDPQQQNRIVVFVSRKEMAHRLRIVLGLLGMKVLELHGSLTQEQRLQSVKDFRSLAVPVLICTDLAARGLDIPKIEIVINFDMPKTHEIYLHRVGRTARAGREGRSITFVGESNQDRSIVKDAIKSLEEQKNGKAVSRTVDWKKVEELNSIVESKKDTIDEVLEEEKLAKEILQAEMQLEKASNIMKHEKEIHSRPKRTWFQSEQEKKQAQRTPVMQLLTKHGKKVNSKKRKAHEERKEEKRSYKKTKSDRSAPKTKAKSKKRK